MDISVKKRVNDILQQLDNDGLAISMADPVAKMMLVAVAHEADTIDRNIDKSIDRLSERFVNKILTNNGLSPLPAISLLKIDNGKEYNPYTIDEKIAFTHKTSKCNFRPLLPSRIIPGTLVAYYANGLLHFPYNEPVSIQHGEMVHENELWIAYNAAGELDTLADLIIAVNHPLDNPRNLTALVGKRHFDLRPVMDEELYAVGDDLMMLEYWKRNLVFHRLWLYRFGADDSNMPLVTSTMPDWLYDMYEAETLAALTSNRLIWIKITNEGNLQVPADSHIEFNCVPVANFDINTVKLSYTEPIKPLDNPKNNSQFYSIVLDNELVNEFFVRDFDVEQYDNARIADDIQNLYRHYTNDYFAFIDNNSLTDGIVLRNLRMSMLQVMDSLAEVNNSAKPFAGSYAIRTPRNNNMPIAVSYITTQGMRGNMLKSGEKLSSSFAATGEAISLIDAQGGRDKITGSIGKRELARFIVNSDNRIYTEMDLIQYCKVELIRALGDEALRYCEISLSHKTVPVDNHIEKNIIISLVCMTERVYLQIQSINLPQYLDINIGIHGSFSHISTQTIQNF